MTQLNIFTLDTPTQDQPDNNDGNTTFAYVAAGFIFIWWCYDMCCCETSRYLRHKMTKEKTQKHLKEVRNNKPVCRFHAKC